ncbi:hypothetical protein PYJP_01240 [Pyrofollis japonicus]|uniref:hypothetical protein n=1 Tax=Pyrofollis japonicus TaxID=3060460 RepID=UPI00295B32CA|nr:hypothetical protein [Pyrofollis japonicus]BEP16772.1 hypothetical protein PYJP_01240 [Pyrofollis japonicus]
MVYVDRLRRIAPGLFAALNSLAKQRIGVGLESLSRDEFVRLVEEFLPGRSRILANIVYGDQVNVLPGSLGAQSLIGDGGLMLL